MFAHAGRYDDDTVTGDQVLELFRQAGALLEGHFRLTSGLHSPGYLQCALVLQRPEAAAALGAAIADSTRALGANAVLSPAIGGIVIGHEVGRALGVRALFVERQDGVFQLRRGFTLDPGDRVLVVEDVVTTAGSTREAIDAARRAGADVVGAASILYRGASDPALDVPYISLATVALPTYQPESCPLCLGGIPAVKPGSRT